MGDLLPPEELRDVGGGDFKAIGEEFLHYFVDLGRLKPTDDVLEVGCGIGRMAIPLTGYLTTGTYTGFDVVPSSIEWCAENITLAHPNFTFRLVDLQSVRYNPRGAGDAASYTFEQTDASFDFVLLTSVFTHLLSDATANYVREIARVLRPGGRCFSTWCLVGDDVREAVRALQTRPHLPFERGEMWLHDEAIPEAVVGYDEAFVRGLLASAGLQVATVAYGKWSGRSHYLSHQDIVVAVKPA